MEVYSPFLKSGVGPRSLRGSRETLTFSTCPCLMLPVGGPTRELDQQLRPFPIITGKLRPGAFLYGSSAARQQLVLAGPCGASRDLGLFSAGVLTHLFSRLFWVIRRQSKSSQAASFHGQRLMSTNLPGRGGMVAFAGLAMCFSLQVLHTGKAFSCVWLSVGGSPALLYWDSASSRVHERDHSTLAPSHSTSSATSPTQPLALPYCWCHLFGAKIALKIPLAPVQTGVQLMLGFQAVCPQFEDEL